MPVNRYSTEGVRADLPGSRRGPPAAELASKRKELVEAASDNAGFELDPWMINQALPQMYAGVLEHAKVADEGKPKVRVGARSAEQIVQNLADLQSALMDAPTDHDAMSSRNIAPNTSRDEPAPVEQPARRHTARNIPL